MNTYGHNRSLGERCADALEEYARAKSDAERLSKLAKRVLAQCFIHAEGKNAAERDAQARVNPKYIAIEDDLIRAETDANMARAKADGLQLQFEEYRTRESTRRAEMQLK